MIKTAIFDLDGTLLNTIGDLSAAVNVALAENGLGSVEEDKVKMALGNGYRRLLADTCKNMGYEVSQSQIDKLMADFSAYYIEHCDCKTAPYEGVDFLLETLKAKGIKLAVVSNKGDSAVKKLAAKYFSNIGITVGEREGIRRKPEPDSILEVMRQLGAKKEEVAYIGDSEVDYETYKNAGIKYGILVDWGFRDAKDLEKYKSDVTAIVSSPEELLTIILKTL
jgi:phosphoglycolate phosphatase